MCSIYVSVCQQLSIKNISRGSNNIKKIAQSPKSYPKLINNTKNIALSNKYNFPLSYFFPVSKVKKESSSRTNNTINKRRG